MKRVKTVDKEALRVSMDGLEVYEKHKTTHIWKKKKLNKDKAGYWYCGTRAYGLKSYIHRLVAMVHVSNPHGYKEVNHIDGDKSNNHASNLEWCSRRHNQQHAMDNGLLVQPRGEAHSQAKLTNEAVSYIRETYKPGIVKQKDLAARFGVSQAVISHVLHGKSWKD